MQSNGARSSPAPGQGATEKDGVATPALLSGVGVGLGLGKKEKEKASTGTADGKATATGTGKKRPASAVASAKENGSDKRKKGLKRL